MDDWDSTAPSPGWYPDPGGGDAFRYWDGTAWTQQTAPAAATTSGPWGPSSDPGQFGSYAPVTSILAPSGMRRVPELFNDLGRMLRRAWWPIIAISLVVWFGWLVISAALGALLMDVGRLITAFATLSDAFARYPQGAWPNSVSREIEDSFIAAVRLDTPWLWFVVPVVVVILAVVASCFQITAVNRLGMDAAAGQPVSFAAAVHSGWRGGARLFGYVLLLTLLALAAVAVLTLLIMATISIPPLAVLIGMTATIAFVVVAVLLTGRLIPTLVQVVVAGGAVRWSWQATRGKFWAVVGRYLLWSLIASLVAQIALSIVLLPFSLVGVVAAADPGSGAFLWFTAASVLTLPLSMAVAALTYLGAVPIWRDLTTDPAYRSITSAGTLADRP